MRVGPDCADCVTLDRGDRRLVLLVLVSVLLHAVLVAGAFVTRRPPPDVELIGGGCWPRLRPTYRLKAVRRARLAPAKNLGVLRVITARGDGDGEMRDLLAHGAPDRDADEVFARIGGVTVP